MLCTDADRNNFICHTDNSQQFYLVYEYGNDISKQL